MIHQTYLALANDALTYYLSDDGLDPNNPDHELWGGRAEFLTADLKDLYKNGNLADVFSYLEELSEADYEIETDLINESRETLSKYIIRAYDAHNTDDIAI